MFVTGPGFQMAQIFVEKIFEKHVDWMKLINDDDNYKNILQVKIQKEFKTTPDYYEIERDLEEGYKWEFILCLGQHFYEAKPNEAISFAELKSFEKVHEILENDKKILVWLGSGKHKIKRRQSNWLVMRHYLYCNR